MRTTVHLPDERGEQIRALAEEAGISQSEWLRRVIDAACIPSASPPHTSAYPDASSDAYPVHTSAYLEETATEALQAALDLASKAEAALAALEAERDQAREVLAATITRVAVLEAEAKKDGEHIKSLQSAIATVAAGHRGAPEMIEAPAATATDEAPAETTRPGILDGIRAWLRR